MTTPKFAPVALCALLLAASSAEAVTFKGIDMALTGSAVLVGADLQLTKASGGLVAGAWATGLLDVTQSFSTTFSFSLQAADFVPQADGMALVLQTGGSAALGTGGGGIGLAGLTGVASVIQTWDNNRAGLVTNGDAYTAPISVPGMGTAATVTGQQTVSYNAGSHTLAVVGTFDLDGTPVTLNHTVSVDLAAVYAPLMTIGFVGGTGLSYADQRITDWSVSSVPEPGSTGLLLAGLLAVGLAARRRLG